MNFFVVIAIVLLFTICNADVIILTNDQSATTQILDTNGCSVTILRNGSQVIIKKAVIKRIIWKTDTISFDGYVCTEKPKSVVRRAEDAPEYKLMALLDNCHEQSLPVKDSSRIAFLYSPLEGNFNAGEFVGVQFALIEILKKKGTVTALSTDEMLAEINAEQHKFDYLFIPRKYHVVVSSVNQHNSVIGNIFGKPKGVIEPEYEVKKELITVADFVLYGINGKNIVFRKSLFETRKVWGEREYSFSDILSPKEWKQTWASILIPKEWKQEWEKKQTEHQLDKNAQNIRKRMEKELSLFLGLKN